MQSKVSQIRDYLKDPKHIDQLLTAASHTIEPAGKPFQFLRMPLYYPQVLPRGSFSILFNDGSRLFLKVNSLSQKIETEIKAFKVLNFYHRPGISFPTVLDFGQATDLTGNDRCAWILTEWVLGSAIQLDNHEGLNQLAMALANLHGLQIDLQDLDRLLGISLPAPSVLLNSSRKQMITEIEEAIQIVPLDLARELEEAVKVLLDQPPTPYLSLNHGDFHTNNGLLAPRNDQPFLVLIDWEDALLESPLFDLAHFIFMSGMEAGRLFVRAYIASADQLLDDVLKGSDPSLLWALACMFSGRAFRWKYLRDPKSCSDFYGESFGLIKELKTLSQKGLLL